MINLTYNEKKIVQMLLEKGNITDTGISAKLNISKQAIGKIRKKLEEKKIIQGYSINVDLKSIGIDLISIIKINIKSGGLNINNEIKKFISTNTDIIRAHTIIFSKPGIILVCGFSNLDQLNIFVKEMADNLYVEVEEVFVSKIDDTLKDSYSDLVKGLLKRT